MLCEVSSPLASTFGVVVDSDAFSLVVVVSPLPSVAASFGSTVDVAFVDSPLAAGDVVVDSPPGVADEGVAVVPSWSTLASTLGTALLSNGSSPLASATDVVLDSDCFSSVVVASPLAFDTVSSDFPTEDVVDSPLSADDVAVDSLPTDDVDDAGAMVVS